ncbi:MAG: U32 family peptidase C-terminal domain-containing protein, partial [Oscillospiraceae bacterium]|nr:U32 family peptidase C-terminal domain-containing protein [Oscillospiraceae bacterium]
TEDSGYIRDYDIAAVVIEHKNGMLYCEQRNKIQPDTDAEIVIPFNMNNTNSIFIPIKIGELFDEKNTIIPDTRHAKMQFHFKYDNVDENSKADVSYEYSKTDTTYEIPSGSIIRIQNLKT